MQTIDQSNPALFKLLIDKLPNTVLWSYGVNLPGISYGETIVPTPFIDVKLPGDKLSFDPLVVNFIVQEDLSNYIEIFDWMIGMGHPESLEQYNALSKKNPNLSSHQNRYSDAQLIITSTKYNPLVKVTFRDAFPIALSSLTYDASITDASPLTTDVTFSYTYYTIQKL